MNSGELEANELVQRDRRYCCERSPETLDSIFDTLNRMGQQQIRA